MKDISKCVFSCFKLIYSFVLGAGLMVFNPFHGTAQNMELELIVPSTGWKKPIANGEEFFFPAAAMQPPTLNFFIKNTGTETLNIGSFYLDGDNITQFTILGLVELSINPGQQTSFGISYNPPSSFTQQSSASFIINNNSLDNPIFTLEMRGAGSELYGPYSPLYGELQSVYIETCPQINNCIGRESGIIQAFSLAEQADFTDTYRGTIVNGEGDLWIRVSLDGGEFTESENLSFSPSESNLSQGILVHRGNSFVNTTDGDIPVFLKYVETYTRPDGSPLVLIAPETLGLPADIGGLAKFEFSTDSISSHNIILASDSYNGTFTPFLDYFEAIPNRTCFNCGHYSIYKRFYWLNMPPVVTANSPLGLKPNETAIITTDLLNAHDYEELPPPAGDLPYLPNPANVMFDFNSTTPLPEGSGILYLNGTPVTATTTFTLADLQAGLLTYENTNPDATNDSFVFRVHDTRGAFANDSGNTVYTFSIIIDEFIGIGETTPNSDKNNLQVFTDPNKQEALARFVTPKTEKVKLALYNLSGSHVADLFNGNTSANTTVEVPINIMLFPSGIYLLLLQTEQGVAERVKFSIIK